MNKQTIIAPFPHLVEALAAAQQGKGGIMYIESTATENWQPYSLLFTEATELLGSLQQAGVRRGDEVVFHFDSNQLFLQTFWACMLGGFIAVPVSWGKSREHSLKLLRIWNCLDCPWFVTDDPDETILANVADAAEAVTIEHLISRRLFIGNMANGILGMIVYPQPTDIAFLQFTSGSTGEPKGVVLTHGNLLADISGIIERQQTCQADRILSWLPLTHDFGLIYAHLTAVVAGASFYLMPTFLFVRHPLLWMQKASEHRITVSGSPNFGYKHFLSAWKSEMADTLDLSALRIITNGAEPIAAALCRKFTEALAPASMRSTVICAGYGLAEACVAVTIDEETMPLHTIRVSTAAALPGTAVHMLGADEDTQSTTELVRLGRPLFNCAVRITDDTDRALEELHTGHIQLRGSQVTAGYYNNPAASAHAFTTDGWLRTGDIGFMADGCLYLAGRQKEIIIVNGQNYYPFDIERVAEEVQGVEVGRVACCSVRQRNTEAWATALFIHCNTAKLKRFDELTALVRSFVNKALNIRLDYIIPVTGIPKTTSGKIQRVKLQQLFEAGEYDLFVQQQDAVTQPLELHIPSEASLENILVAIWQFVLRNKELNSHADFFALGGQSLQAAQLAGHIASYTGIEITFSDIFTAPTPAAMAILVAQKDGIAFVPEVGNTSETVFPATPAQLSLFLLQQSNPLSVAYNISLPLCVNGPVAKANWINAFTAVVKRHTVLRSTFQYINGVIMQVVHPAMNVEAEELVVPAATHATRVIKDFFRPFRLDESPLFRMAFVQEEQVTHILFDFHHIICDGVSLAVLMNDMQQQLAGVSALPLPVQFGSYMQQYQAHYTHHQRAADEVYWQGVLGNLPPAAEFPCDYPRPAIRNFSGAVETILLDTAAYTRLQQLGCETACTMNMLVFAAYNLLLAQYTGQQELVLGTSVSGRKYNTSTNMAGMFVNTLPLPCRVAYQQSLVAFLQHVKQLLLASYDHDQYPFADMLTLAGVRAGSSRNPLFDLQYVFHDFVMPVIHLADGGMAVYEYVHNDSAKFDLLLDVFVQDKQVKLYLNYDTTIISNSTARLFLQRLVRLLTAMPDDHNARLSALLQPSVEEVAWIHTVYNNTSQSFDSSGLLHQLVEDQVLRTPDAVAVKDAETVLTYRRLNECANQIADYIRNGDTAPGRCIGVMAERNVWTVINVLAVLKAGCAYVPIEPVYPSERQRHIMEAANIAGLLNTAVCMQQLQAGIWHSGNPDIMVAPDATAYIIFTSGSTGIPKGVVIQHKAAANTICDINQRFGITASDVIAGISSLCFDLSVYDIFGALSTGASLVQVPDQRDAAALRHTVVTAGITCWNTVPAILQLLLDTAPPDFTAPALKHILLSGDWIPVKLPAAAAAAFPAAVITSLGGATEASVWSIFYPVDPSETYRKSIPYGFPLANQQYYVLNDLFELCPPGIPGDLFIGGAGLAACYLNDVVRTNDSFFQHPQLGRIYRTGDTGRWTVGGWIEFMGRKDTQVKLAGFRIELGEIEAIAHKYPEIEQAFAMVHTSDDNRQILVLYYTGTMLVEVSELHKYLQQQLPYYMLPDSYMQIAEVPLTANGKVDRKALPQPKGKEETLVQQPNTWLQQQLHALWCSLLKVDAISIEAHFFEAGGDSLTANRMIAAIYKMWNKNLSVQALYEHPTIASLALHLALLPADAVYEPLVKHCKEEGVPATTAQEQLYFQSQRYDNDVSYNIPVLKKLTGALDVVRLRNAFEAVFERYDILRSSFTVVQNKLLMQVVGGCALPFEVVEKFEQPLEQQLTGFITTFDVSVAPLIKLTLFRESPTLHWLLLDVHHIICDGIAVSTLLQEIAAVYAGKTIDPPVLQYADYADWVYESSTYTRLRQQSLTYWREIYRTIPPPPAWTAANHAGAAGGTFSCTLPAQVHSKLPLVAKELNVSAYAVTMLAWYRVLYAVAASTDLVIGVPFAGRLNDEVQTMPGMFVNALPVRFAGGDMPWAAQAKALQTVLYEARQAQYAGVIEITAELRRLNVLRPLQELYSIMFSFQQEEMFGFDIPGVQTEHIVYDGATSKVVLTLFVYEKENALYIVLEYDTALFTTGFVQRLADDYTAMLAGILDNPSGSAADNLMPMNGLAATAAVMEVMDFDF